MSSLLFLRTAVLRSASRRLTVSPARVCYYSTSSIVFKKEDPDEEFRKEFEKIEFDDIQTMNADFTPEEAMKMLEDEIALIEAEKEKKFLPNWKPGQRKRPLVTANYLESFEGELSGASPWSLRDKRCGALGIKLGMMPVWDDWGDRHPCTVLYLDSNVVTGLKTIDQHGYMAVQVGAGERKKKNVKSTILGQYKDLPNVQEHPPYIIREFRVTDPECYPEVGAQIHARHFVPGQNVDIAGISKGKGFQGAMKRHGFAGMPATHGVSKSHRALGSTGQCQDPGKVFKGKKMAGRMGADRITVQNLRIVKVDRGRNLLYIRGAIPGNKGSFVEIRDGVKKPLWGTEKVADALAQPPLPTFEFDPKQDGIDQAGFEEFMPMPGQDPMNPYSDAAA
eukprot:CAMPEP_0119015324 /NCGR_PEP_ID=MMETSP1176-20130426/10815_1 /TAXON_ID=265551 /ORGANISM="Synedropsis recta cf, Strain CCMP1620" /LENGTH=392 /DNA_ID=CAMNT_0006968611 /DNA_START=8 /DNA_END=1182 /DNA_ORIENTATION=+